MTQKKYTSYKEVYAEPMNRLDYNNYRGWQLPADEDGSDEGYLVTLNKGLINEHISWSPEDIFQATHTEVKL